MKNEQVPSSKRFECLLSINQLVIIDDNHKTCRFREFITVNQNRINMSDYRYNQGNRQNTSCDSYCFIPNKYYIFILEVSIPSIIVSQTRTFG